jgi:hypothetical protein
LKLSPNQIRLNAEQFVKDWKDETDERREKDTFYNEFFAIFGKRRKSFARFEEYVEKLNDKTGFIDLFWPGVLIAEHKSAGRDLNAAMNQAKEYCEKLSDEEQPRFLMTCDFQHIQLIDLVEKIQYHFELEKLPDKIEIFDFMSGLEQPKVVAENDVSIEASEIMGEIYDTLQESGYPEEDIGTLLTRLTYCLFADDTGIFEPKHILQNYIENRTLEDGSDLGGQIDRLFSVLNTKEDKRQKKLDTDLGKFKYINGNLFEKRLPTADFDSKMRELLIKACEFNWSKVSPAIFGSLFQSVMNKEDRRKKGSHYTTEENILKVIEPLFLDELEDEFEKIMSRKDTHKKKALELFQNKLSNLKFLDPACGAGNFLIITYREIRRLELRVIKELHDRQTQLLDSSILSKVDVNQFYGIEILEFPAEIAKVALWMMDHLMNNELSSEFSEFGILYDRLPLKNHPNIFCTDALEIDWNDVIPSVDCSYILGNPPFAGSNSIKDDGRGEQIKQIANIGDSGGNLDYVCGWFLKSAEYVDQKSSIGFVSTNSITQGQQPKYLFDLLFKKYNLKIDFAHQAFKWESESPGKANVIVVIMGFSKIGKHPKKLFFYNDDKEIVVENPKFISPYLIGSDKQLPVVRMSSQILNNLPQIIKGSQPRTKLLIFTTEEKNEFLKRESGAEKLFRPYVNATEFLRSTYRWILNFQNIEPHELNKLNEIKKILEEIKKVRSKSSSAETRELHPTEYYATVIPTSPFLLVPATTSERREYIPLGYLEPPMIPSNATMIIENADLELFGLLISKMHMIWVRIVGGRLKTDLRYSVKIVYNTFPVPTKGYSSLKKFAEKIIEVRKNHPESTLVDLYDPNSMLPDLKKAHTNLDREVEKLYRTKPFESDNERAEFLLSMYLKMIDKT